LVNFAAGFLTKPVRNAAFVKLYFILSKLRRVWLIAHFRFVLCERMNSPLSGIPLETAQHE